MYHVSVQCKNVKCTVGEGFVSVQLTVYNEQFTVYSEQ